jgi:hypothetical protein
MPSGDYVDQGHWREVRRAGRHTLASTVKVIVNFDRKSVTPMQLAELPCAVARVAMMRSPTRSPCVTSTAPSP